MDIPAEQYVPLAQLIGLGLLGLLAAFGMWWGQRKKLPAENTVEVAGALVDSGSIKLLAAAIEALNVNHAQNRHSDEKKREVAHRLVDVLGDATKEMEEIRKELRELGNTIRKH